MASSQPILGHILGHYRILEQIGAGGMGVVYRAPDEQLDRDVALKVLPAGMLADQDARRRFRREALALARLIGTPFGSTSRAWSYDEGTAAATGTWPTFYRKQRNSSSGKSFILGLNEVLMRYTSLWKPLMTTRANLSGTSMPGSF